jgi:hypothetical protein
MFQTKLAEKIKIDIVCSVTFFSEYHAIYENVKKCGRTRLAIGKSIIRHMLFACWLTKAYIYIYVLHSMDILGLTPFRYRNSQHRYEYTA